MNLKSKLRSRLVNIVFSRGARTCKRRAFEFRRRLFRRPHTAVVFLELDDPYSYLLGEYLRDFRECYRVTLDIRLTQSLGEAYRPQPGMLAEYAETDCRRLAAELGVPFLDKGNAPPVERRRALIDALAKNPGSDPDGSEVLDVLRLYWRGDAESVSRYVSGAATTGQGDATLQRNRALLAELGHYNAATIFYGGEWYWGIDRLHYLADRLDGLGLRRIDAPRARLASLRQVAAFSLPVSPPATARDLPPLDLFYSLRSPYSYLALQRVYDIADAFGLTLRIRPVLPMAMRGMQVPRAKLVYIGNDVMREAERMDIPFGNFADPLGAGIERCLAVFCYALGEKRERDFLLNAGRAIWAQGIDVASDAGLRKVTGRSGLFWPGVKAALDDDGWRGVVAQNRAELMESGAWGVPTLRLGEFVAWGQDRLWLLVRHIEERCDTGEGILI